MCLSHSNSVELNRLPPDESFSVLKLPKQPRTVIKFKNIDIYIDIEKKQSFRERFGLLSAALYTILITGKASSPFQYSFLIHASHDVLMTVSATETEEDSNDEHLQTFKTR